MMSSHFSYEDDSFESKREVIFEESSVNVCDDARQYLENTMKEFRIPMNATTLPFALDYRSSITKIQAHIGEVVNTPLTAILRELDAKKSVWKQLMSDKYMTYRQSHDTSVARTHQALLDSGVPALSRIEQTLRLCSQYTDVNDELTAMAETVHSRTVQANWSERLNAARTEGYPVPRVSLPSKLSAGLELIKEALSEMELSFENISASEPFEAKDTDWFSYSCLEPLLHQSFCGSLVSGVAPDGAVTIQLCELEMNNSLSRTEVLELIVGRLRYRLLLGDPTLRQLALSQTMAKDLCAGTSVAVCRWNDMHPQIYRGQIGTIDTKACRCEVYLIDFGHTDSFDFDEVFIDERWAKDLRSIPPLAIRCHLHTPSQKLQNPAEVEAAIRTFQERNKGRFSFSIVAEHEAEEETAWEIFVSDVVSHVFQFPPPPPPPPSPPPPPQPQPQPQIQPPVHPQLSKLTIKTETAFSKAPARPKNFRPKNSSPKTSTRKKGQPSPKTPPVVPKAETKTPPVPKAGPMDKPRAGQGAPPMFAKQGRSDKPRRELKIHRPERWKSESKPPPESKANKSLAKPTEEPKTPPPPNVGSVKGKYEFTTPPMSNNGRMNKEKCDPPALPLPNADSVGKLRCEPKTAAPYASAAPAQKPSPRTTAAVQRTPPGPRIVPVAKKVFRNTHTTWQKELVQSIVENNSKRKSREFQPPATMQQNSDWSDWGDE